MFQIESVLYAGCQTFSRKADYFAHSFEANKGKRRSSILAYNCNEKLVHLVADVACLDDISTYAMGRCGLNIFSFLHRLSA